MKTAALLLISVALLATNQNAGARNNDYWLIRGENYLQRNREALRQGQEMKRQMIQESLRPRPGKTWYPSYWNPRPTVERPKMWHRYQRSSVNRKGGGSSHLTPVQE